MWTLIVSLALMLCCWFYRRRYGKWLEVASEVPNWKRPLPIIGNLLHVIGSNGNYPFKIMTTLSEEAEKRNSALKVWFGPTLVYYISKPEDIKLVTNAYLGKPFFYDFAKPWVAEGLVTASVAVWKRHVKLVAPTFSPTVVDGFLEVFNTQLLLLTHRLRAELGRGPFAPFRQYLAPATLEMACQTVFGVTNMSQNIVTVDYMEAFDSVMELILLRGFNPLVYPDCLYRLTGNYRKYKRSLKILHDVSAKVIRNKREAMKSKGPGAANDTGYKNFKAFLDLLMELPAEEAFSDEELRAEVDTMIVGGQETTASTLLFTLLNVGSFPHVQDKLYSELKEIFGDSMRAVEKDDLRRMTYAEAVIKETLRLYPPIPNVMRNADHELQLGNYRIAPGTTCAVCLWGTGRWKRSWGEDADQFRPERWLQPHFMPPHSAYIPFSYGKRVCIGRLYSMMVLKTALAHLLRTYCLTADVSKLQLKMDLVLRPAEGGYIELRLR